MRFKNGTHTHRKIILLEKLLYLKFNIGYLCEKKRKDFVKLYAFPLVLLKKHKRNKIRYFILSLNDFLTQIKN